MTGAQTERPAISPPTLAEARAAARKMRHWVTTSKREINDPATALIVIDRGWDSHTGEWFDVVVREIDGQSIDADQHHFRITESGALSS